MSLTEISHANRTSNKIALTFDDGPNPFYTWKILDVLDEYGIKANFFILGMCAEIYPDILKDIFERGHLVGNHSYSHSKESGDFKKSENVISKITGEGTKFIRPPYLDALLCSNYEPAASGRTKVINTDVFPLDHENKADYIFDFVAGKTQNGSIILLHDGSRRMKERETRPAEMFAALPKIIEFLKDKFVFFSRLDEMDFGV
jgi:peptidoglycan/xylan/chitin deacetylase (PgdA/CDA1 family)